MEMTQAGPPGAGASFMQGRVGLGSSGLSAGRFFLGCAPLGGLYEAVTEQQAEATLQEAWRLGVRAFDTAPHYGGGLSERRVGAFLSQQPRDAFVISTKVGRLLVEGSESADAPPEFAGEAPVVRVRDYSAEGVRRSLEESLERLGLDRVDIALVHDPDDYLDDALNGAFPALAELRSQGVVKAIGAGANACAPLERIVAETDVDCVLIAGRYSLLDRRAADALLPLCERRGVGVLAAGVFNGEVLANPRPGAHFDYQIASEEVVERALEMQRRCRARGVELADVAVRFPLSHPAVSAVVVGARHPEEIRADVAAFSREIDPSLITELSELTLAL